MLLAQGLSRSRDIGGIQPEVAVVTPTPSRQWDDAALPFRVVRQPTVATLVALFWRAHVIHLAGPCFLPLLLGILLRKPVIVEHSGYQACCPNGLLLDERTQTVCPGHFMIGRYRECLGCNKEKAGWTKSLTMLLLTFPRRWLCGRVACNVGPSAHIGRRVALPRMVTIHHGVPAPAVVESGGDEAPPRPVFFVYVGRLVWEKGVPVLLEAARRLQNRGYDFHLRIIGDGPQRTMVEELTDRYGLRERTAFTGYLHGEALEAAQRGARATIMASVCEDVAPLAAMENMMQGRLLIVSDIGGLGELVGDVGLKFEAGNAEALASCMQLVLDKPRIAKVLGRDAKQRASQLFSVERMVSEHLELYRELSSDCVRELARQIEQ